MRGDYVKKAFNFAIMSEYSINLGCDLRIGVGINFFQALIFLEIA